MTKRAKTIIGAYSLAVLFVAIAATVAWLLDWQFKDPFLPFTAAVALTAWFAGFGPGLAATALATIAISLFLPSWNSVLANVLGNLSFLGLFVAVSLVVNKLSSSYARTVVVHRVLENTLRSRDQELEKAHQAIQHEARITKAILQCMGDGVIVADRDGKLLLFNPAAEEILKASPTGAEPSEWARLYGLYLADRVTLYPADDLPLVKALRGETVYADEIYVCHSNLPNGRWVMASARPLRDQDGLSRGAVVVLTDVTDRKIAEEMMCKIGEKLELQVRERTAALARTSAKLESEASQRQKVEQVLQESEQIFETFMDNSPIAAYMKDSSGRLVYFNRSFEQFFKKHLADPDSLGEGPGPFEYIEWPEDVSGEHAVPVQSPRYWRAHQFPIQDASGGTLLGGVAVDITDGKHLGNAAYRTVSGPWHHCLPESISRDINNLVIATSRVTDLCRSLD